MIGSRSCRGSNSSIFNCLTWFVSSWQILGNSSISWIVLTLLSWRSLHLTSNSPHTLIFFLWAWRAHWFAWCSSILWDSSSRWVSYRAISELFCFHLLMRVLHERLIQLSVPVNHGDSVFPITSKHLDVSISFAHWRVFFNNAGTMLAAAAANYCC